ncbi:hypothetical protein HII17_07875 [Thalassotalea sp. M1531]|uniref:Uncharacterized protein n=1 Tax=Thalassotalea algicola TaxID=2716224 RepID=A0A7Y0Q6T2_9GAMM|nr:hypothetical protein [Thalassotalea algicola]NMP31476.1 hypothetical protein [Thalassotalea algicola]
MNIQFNVRYLIAEAPFELYVSVPNERYTIKRGYMEGVDMFMGKIPLFFDAHTAEEVIAESMFGSCSQDKMQWRIWLEVIDKELGETVVQTVSFTITSYRGMKALPASS